MAAARISLAGDRPAVLELGLYQGPGAAGRAAAQRIDRQHQLVAGFDGFGGHAVPGEDARRGTFQVPNRAGAVFSLDFDENEAVRAGITEFHHGSGELDWVLLIEHRE